MRLRHLLVGLIFWLSACNPCLDETCPGFDPPNGDDPNGNTTEIVACLGLEKRWQVAQAGLSKMQWSPAETQFSGFEATGFQRFLSATDGTELFSVFFDQFNRFTGWNPVDTRTEMSTSSQLRLLETESGAVVSTINHNFGVVAATAWRTDEKWIALSNQRKIMIRETATADFIKELVLHHDDVLALAWNNTSGWLASGDKSGLVVVWDEAAWSPVTSFTASSVGIRKLRWLDGSGDLVVELNNKTTQRYASDTWELAGTIVEGVLNADGTVIAALGDQRTLRLFSAKTSSALCQVALGDFRSPAELEWAAQSDAIAVYGLDLGIWDVELVRRTNP